jgi:hypothetical protein
MPAIPVNYTEIHHFQGHDRGEALIVQAIDLAGER